MKRFEREQNAIAAAKWLRRNAPVAAPGGALLAAGSWQAAQWLGQPFSSLAVLLLVPAAFGLLLIVIVGFVFESKVESEVARWVMRMATVATAAVLIGAVVTAQLLTVLAQFELDASSSGIVGWPPTASLVWGAATAALGIWCGLSFAQTYRQYPNADL